MAEPSPVARLTLSEALQRLAAAGGEDSVLLYEHGTLRAKLYAPRGRDDQTPHRQDEIYVVASGTGRFFDGAERRTFEPGTFLFAAAGRPHRFEDFSDNFSVWVFFYGPDGGEVAAPGDTAGAWLLVTAFVGLVIGDGLFAWWLLRDFQGFGPILQNRLALSFIVDAVLTLLILTIHFARRPPGPVRWPWFVALSLLGGLCFGIPFYWWLNKRPRAA